MQAWLDMGGAPDVAVKYYFGGDCLLYFTAGDINDLGDKIQFAYLNKDVMQVRAEKAYQAAQPLDWDAMVKKYVSIVEQRQIQPLGS